MLSAHHDHTFIADWNDDAPMETAASVSYRLRALRIWPGLDRERLRRTHGDPWRIARLVETRTSLTMEAILVLLMGPDIDARLAGGRPHDRHLPSLTDAAGTGPVATPNQH